MERPLRDTASGIISVMSMVQACQRPASLHPLGGHQVDERLLIGIDRSSERSDTWTMMSPILRNSPSRAA